MEKSNLPLPLKKRIVGEATSGVRDGLKLEKRSKLVRDSSGRVLKERPQFGGSYLKKRFGYSSKKTGVPFSLKGSKAVVTSLCAAGDFADACFNTFSENTDSAAEESLRVKRGALSMKSKLLQLQERNRLILAKHQFPRSSSANTHLNPELTSAILMTPLTLKIETTEEEEVKTCDEPVRLGESCSTSPIYHELDPIDGHLSSPDQHTYQSISEVREEMARLQAQTNLGNAVFSGCKQDPANNHLKISELSTREPQRKIYESPGNFQESGSKQNRAKRSIFSKFWLSKRNLLSTQEDATTSDGKAVLTSITSLPDDEITKSPQGGGEGLEHYASHVGSCSLTQPSSTNSSKYPQNATGISCWNEHSSHSLTAEDLQNIDSSQGWSTPTDSSCYSNARQSCSNRDGAGNSYNECHYGWKSDEELESDRRHGPDVQQTLQSFAKRSTIRAGMKSKAKAAEEYQSSVEMANALTEYHWNIYQTGNANKTETLGSTSRAGDFLEALGKDAISLHQDQWVTSHFLPIQLTSDQSKGSVVLNMGFDAASDVYNVDTAFLCSRSPISPSFFGRKIPHSQYSSPSCGVRMAEMRAVRRKSESALLSEPSSSIVPCSASSSIVGLPCFTTCRHGKQEETLLTVEPSPCAQRELNHIIRNIDTILEEDQLTENVTSCHLAIPPHSPTPSLSPECSTSPNKHSDSSQTVSTLNPSTDPLNAERKIPEEMLSSDGSTKDYERKPVGDLRDSSPSQTKQSADSKTNGRSRLKKPKPIKHCTAASSHKKPPNITGEDCSSMLHFPTEQQNTLKTRKTENATPSTPILFNSKSTMEREPKPLIRHALIRKTESVSSGHDVPLELLESPHPRRTLQPTSRIKSGSGIPCTKNLTTSRTYSTTHSICSRESEILQKRVDCRSQQRQSNQRRIEEGLLTFGRSHSVDIAFKHKERISCVYSDNSTSSSSEMSNAYRATCDWANESRTPEVVVDCLKHSLESSAQLSSPSEYHVSELSSLSSSLTSSSGSGSVFGVTESESDSPTSSSARDLLLESESPSSSSASSRRMEIDSVIIPVEVSGSKNAESTAKKPPQRGKSQLVAPRTDSTRCLDRLERLRIETKQTKNEFHQKLRH